MRRTLLFIITMLILLLCLELDESESESNEDEEEHATEQEALFRYVLTSDVIGTAAANN
jgi:hypothetical protein